MLLVKLLFMCGKLTDLFTLRSSPPATTIKSYFLVDFASQDLVAVPCHSFLILWREKLQEQVLETVVLLGAESDNKMNKYGYFRIRPFTIGITTFKHHILLLHMNVLDSYGIFLMVITISEHVHYGNCGKYKKAARKKTPEFKDSRC